MALNPLAARIMEVFEGPHDVGLRPSSELAARFGDFSIVVVPDWPDTATRVLGAHDAANDVWWRDASSELSDGPPRWTAIRDWNHVRLLWTTDSPALDDRWHDLVELLHAAGLDDFRVRRRSSST